MGMVFSSLSPWGKKKKKNRKKGSSIEEMPLASQMDQPPGSAHLSLLTSHGLPTPSTGSQTQLPAAQRCPRLGLRPCTCSRCQEAAPPHTPPAAPTHAQVSAETHLELKAFQDPPLPQLRSCPSCAPTDYLPSAFSPSLTRTASCCSCPYTCGLLETRNRLLFISSSPVPDRAPGTRRPQWMLARCTDEFWGGWMDGRMDGWMEKS